MGIDTDIAQANPGSPQPEPLQQNINPALPPSPEQLYAERSERFKGQFEAESRLWNRIANLRLLAFVLATVSLGWGVWQAITLFQIAGLVFGVAFVVLVRYHGMVSKRRRRYQELWKINTEAIKRIERAWDQLPLRHTIRANPGEPYAADLDIFGHASLFHLLDTLTTHIGETILAGWLRDPASPQTVRERQEAAAEIAPMVELRDELELRGRLISEQRPDPERFLAWAEGDRWLAHRPWLRWGAVVSVAALWLLIVAQIIGLVATPVWAAFALLNFAFTLTMGRKVYELLEQASEKEAGFRHYGAAFELICAAPFQSAMLKQAQAKLGKDGVDAAAYAHRLYRLTTLVTSGSSAIYILVQSMTLWDTHVLAAFERWQREVGSRARGWLEVLGEVEALSALARLSHDNPGWAFPQVGQDATALQAQALGHPLIPASRRVDNDVQIGPPGTFLLVTGSNMSGKSTLLRAIGVNVVLAGAGGPVCAASLTMPPVDLWTSMRVEDSLERGVSYYMAELQRLKSVVDAARLDRSAGERRLLYLLDEILQGTNTVERQIAARRVIMYLVRQGAIGAVSTHDLTLTDDPGVSAAAQPVHFTETLSNGQGGPAMTFDYKLRPGIATSTNALRLMQIVGLDLSEGEAETRPVKLPKS